MKESYRGDSWIPNLDAQQCVIVNIKAKSYHYICINIVKQGLSVSRLYILSYIGNGNIVFLIPILYTCLINDIYMSYILCF